MAASQGPPQGGIGQAGLHMVEHRRRAQVLRQGPTVAADQPDEDRDEDDIDRREHDMRAGCLGHPFRADQHPGDDVVKPEEPSEDDGGARSGQSLAQGGERAGGIPAMPPPHEDRHDERVGQSARADQYRPTRDGGMVRREREGEGGCDPGASPR